MYQPAQALTFDQANEALQHGLQAIASGQTDIDLSKVVAIDSSAIAVLLNWQQAAYQASRTLRLIGAPGNLLSLIDVYGVAGLLTIEATAVATAATVATVAAAPAAPAAAADNHRY